jgi:hypothetical protein
VGSNQSGAPGNQCPFFFREWWHEDERQEVRGEK